MEIRNDSKITVINSIRLNLLAIPQVAERLRRANVILIDGVLNWKSASYARSQYYASCPVLPKEVCDTIPYVDIDLPDDPTSVRWITNEEIAAAAIIILINSSQEE